VDVVPLVVVADDVFPSTTLRAGSIIALPQRNAEEIEIFVDAPR
jgi:hypothetical protein